MICIIIVLLYLIYNPLNLQEGNTLYGEECCQVSGQSIAVNSEAVTGQAIAREEVEIFDPAKIRVLLKTNGFKGYYHKKVSVSSTNGMRVSGNGFENQYEAGKSVSYNMESAELNNGSISFCPLDGGKLIVKSIKRGCGKPCYRGILEVSRSDAGILLVNEVTMDEYLYGVVPSEMPSSYGVEALKVQAVCARSYAYIHIKTSRLSAYNANVDDSTAYQVYGNCGETQEGIQAVNETSGQVLTYNGSVVPAYYYSTSCGVTARGDEVWLGMKEIPYLVSRVQSKKSKITGSELSDSKEFEKFLQNDSKTYDSGFAWYRWNVDMTSEDIGKSVAKNLETRYKANPTLILTRNDAGLYESKEISEVGDIKGIKVAKRGQGGIVISIIIKGTKNTIKVNSEYNIRTILAPLSSKIIRNDEKVVDGMTLLPSAFFIIKKEGSGKNALFHIKGGGYGHGVGMSQNGAGYLVEHGYDYISVLKHYYEGCEVEKKF